MIDANTKIQELIVKINEEIDIAYNLTDGDEWRALYEAKQLMKELEVQLLNIQNTK